MDCKPFNQRKGFRKKIIIFVRKLFEKNILLPRTVMSSKLLFFRGSLRSELNICTLSTGCPQYTSLNALLDLQGLVTGLFPLLGMAEEQNQLSKFSKFLTTAKTKYRLPALVLSCKMDSTCTEMKVSI